MQKVALLAQVSNSAHEERQRAAVRPAEGQHIRQGNGLHALLQGIEVGHDLVLQHGEQPVPFAEVVVESAAGHRPARIVVHGERIVAALSMSRQVAPRRGAPRFRDAPILAGSGRRAGYRGYDGLLRSVAMQRSHFDRTAKMDTLFNSSHYRESTALGNPPSPSTALPKPVFLSKAAHGRRFSWYLGISHSYHR